MHKVISQIDILKSENIVQAWLFVENKILNYDINLSVELLNDNLQLKYRTSRIWEWYRCENSGRGVQIPKRVRRYMSNIVLPYALKAYGFRDKTLEKINFKKLAVVIN